MSGACCGWIAKLEVTQSSSYVETIFKVAALSLATISLFVFDTATSLLEYVFCCKKNEEEDPNKIVPFTQAEKKFLGALIAEEKAANDAKQTISEAFEHLKATPDAFQVLLDIVMVVPVDDADERVLLIEHFNVNHRGNALDVSLLQEALGLKSPEEVGGFLKRLASYEDLVAQIVPASSSTAKTVEAATEDARC